MRTVTILSFYCVVLVTLLSVKLYPESLCLLMMNGVFTGEEPSGPNNLNLTMRPGGWWICRTTGVLRIFRDTSSPFDRDAISQVNGGFTTGGTGWYRKRLYIGEENKDKIISVLFEGVYMNAECWFNGHSLGSHPYGYTSFSFDITPYMQFGAENILAVKVRNEGENSRWYSGSGIYRHVWLIAKEPVHLSLWGTVISTKPKSAVRRISI